MHLNMVLQVEWRCVTAVVAELLLCIVRLHQQSVYLHQKQYDLQLFQIKSRIRSCSNLRHEIIPIGLDNHVVV